MRKICSSIIPFIAMALLANAQINTFATTDLVTDVIIVRDASASTKPRMPEKDPLVFYGYVVAPTNSLVLSSSKAVNADVHIENLTYGYYADYTTSITTTPVSMGIMGPGSYRLIISLSGGDTYSGDFDL